MFCTKCGDKISEGVAFCTECGNKVDHTQNHPPQKYGEEIIMSTGLAQPNRFQELLYANNMTHNVKLFEGLYTDIAVRADGYIAIYHPHIPEETVKTGVFKKETYPEEQEWLEILHISQVNDIDIDVDGTEMTSVSGGLGGALVGGLLGGTLGAVIGSAATSGNVSSHTTYDAINLIIHTKDFNNPRIEVLLYRCDKTANSLASWRIGSYPSGLHKHLKHKKYLGSNIYELDKEGQRLYEDVYGDGQPNFKVIEELHSTLSQLLNAQEQSETAAASAPQLSAADELAKFKGLLDSGVITQDEFDAKKKQLLGL